MTYYLDQMMTPSNKMTLNSPMNGKFVSFNEYLGFIKEYQK